MGKARRWLVRLTGILAPTVVLLLLLEGGLRLFGISPSGYFDFLLPAKTGLYPPGRSILNYWGQIPYVVETNSLGLRGPEISRKKAAGKKRVALIGDSMTDGFFVDNEATFPHYLQEKLDSLYPGQFEVMNCARGGASIDKELAILREVALPLDPDMAILTFVTNDIYELQGKSSEDVLHSRLEFHPQGMSRKRKCFTAFVTKTAIGELAMRTYWKAFVLKRQDTIFGPERYQIPDGTKFLENAKLFRERFGCCDGIILEDTFSTEVNEAVGRYLEGLSHFGKSCREAGVEPFFVYCPAYSQIYETGSSEKIRHILRSFCESEGIPFLDLTMALRKKGKGKVLHLAPVDFHFNPEGNRIMAGIVADSLFIY
jgi:lysophospholipase L1-like esterase